MASAAKFAARALIHPSAGLWCKQIPEDFFEVGRTIASRIVSIAEKATEGNEGNEEACGKFHALVEQRDTIQIYGSWDAATNSRVSIRPLRFLGWLLLKIRVLTPFRSPTP